MALDGKFHEGKIQLIEVWGCPADIGNPNLIAEMLTRIVRAIGMTPHGEPNVTTYPTPELGFTTSQPIAFEAIQHLYESYIVYDNWVELEPAYANIIINSCKMFYTTKAIQVIRYALKPIHVEIHKPILYTGRIK